MGPNGRLFAQNFQGQLFCVSGDSLQLVGDFKGMHSQFVSFGFQDDDLVVATQYELRRYSTNTDTWPISRNSPFDTVLVANAPLIHVVSNLGGLVYNFGGGNHSTFGKLKLDEYILPRLNLQSTRPQGDSTWVIYSGKVEGKTLTLVKCIDANGSIREIARLHLPTTFINRGKLYVQGLDNGDILIGGIRGMLLVENPSSTHPKITNLLPGTSVNDVKTDQSGNLWIATPNQGLLLIPDLNVRQQDFPMVHASIVDFVAPENGNFLYGLTFNGTLYQLHPSFKCLAEDGWHFRFWQNADDDFYISHVQIHPTPTYDLSQALLIGLGGVKESVLLPDGTIAIATASRALLRYPHGDPRVLFKSTLFPYRDLHFIGQMGALINERKGSELRSRRCTGIAFDDKSDKLYVAYNDSLICYPTGLGPATSIADSLIGGRAHFLKLVDDKLYIGLGGTGLSVFDLKTNSSIQLLPNLAIKRIHRAGNKVWLETNAGIYRSTLGNESPNFQPIDTRAGLPPGKPTAFFADEEFGYAVYDRRVVRIRSDQTPAKSSGRVITFAKTERAGLALANPNQQFFKVTANEQTLRFLPRVPDYSESPETSFEFKLDQSDKIWQRIGGDNADIFINGLSEGKHQLDVRLAGQPETQSTYFIEARVPFWRKPWPYVIGITALATFVILTMRRRARERHAQAERKTALRESQLSALAAQMNPHFIFNALNSVQDFIMSNDRLAASDYLTKFARLIRLTLEHSRNTEITLKQELEMMGTYLDLERVRFDDEIMIDFSCSESLRLSAKLPPMVVQPYVENAFKHGLIHRLKDRRLRVAYDMPSPKMLRVVVEDNGVGRTKAAALSDASRTGSKFATGATARRLELLNSMYFETCRVQTEDLIENGIATGTRVTLELRVSPEITINKLNKPETDENT